MARGCVMVMRKGVGGYVCKLEFVECVVRYNWDGCCIQASFTPSPLSAGVVRVAEWGTSRQTPRAICYLYVSS